MNKPVLRRALSTTAAAGATAALMMAGLAGASAHVGADPNKTAANSYALVTFGIPHGCDTSPTTKVTITLPEELTDAQPTVNPNWTVEKVTETLDAPKKLDDGTSITKRTGQIVYTAKTPLDPHLRDALVLSVKLPDAAGKTIYFPTLQTCEQGQVDWSEVPKAGQKEDGLKSPAPSVTITPADSSGDHHGASTETTEQAASVTSDDSTALGWAGLIAGLAGLVLGGAAFLRSRTAKTGTTTK
ncbi:YcnI family protein [Paenarthrobacter sp. YJN-5]|uniref:YcnI family copper-binding membrane protein n=1 Tax=Paenarthrobacter sp. YJN-5 TaxID=2735316 RepID=UPI0018789EDD|nr:YcnI family protein [Paenarthrobacter sp. YJN-5]QOT18251.1 YcnI family protein [Paenarthrobacter sp. YJN-5]